MLAFACAFTMFAGAASFTDAADISDVNADAVELLSALNIIQGDPDGSFAPEREVTRAEMAKMIYTIRNGGNDDASAYETVTTSFTDISGHWAEGYIKYLQNTGIVAGKSAYIFDPDSTVTTGEAMKMALVLAGYRADKAELTGTNWLNNTVSRATTVGMTKNVQSSIAGGCTRQDAAQILYNTLTEVYAVQWSEVTNSFLHDSKTGLAFAGARITVGNKWMDLNVYVGQMTSSGKLAIADDAAGKDKFAVDVDTLNGYNYSTKTHAYVTFKDGKDHTDLVGMEVKVLTGEKSDEIYGVYATSTSKVVETTMDQIDVVEVTDGYKLKVDGKTYDTVGSKVFDDLESSATVKKVFTTNGEKVADTVKMIDWDDDGDYETILVNTVNVAELNYIGSKSLTLGDAGSKDGDIRNKTQSIDLEDATVYEGAAKGDYVVFTKNVYDDTWNIEKLEAISGTVNGRVDNERKIRVEGTWYTLANNANGKTANDKDLYTISTSRSAFTNGDAVTLYAVGSIVYMAKSTTGNDANRTVLMVYDIQPNADEWAKQNKVKAIFADGDKETITINSKSAVAFGALQVGQMYSYDVNNDDEYLLTELDTKVESSLAGYDKALNSNGITSGKVANTAIADDAVVFAMIGANDAKVYTGKQVKDAAEGKNYGDFKNNWTDVAAKQQALIQTEGGFTYARMFNLEIAELNSIVNYGWLLEDSVMSTNDGSKVMEYTFWDGTDMRTAMQRTNSDLRELGAGTLITFSEDGEGYIKDVRDIDEADGLTAAAITAADGNKIAIIRMNRYDEFADVIEADSDTKVIYVNSNEDANEDKCVTESGYGHYAGYDGSNRWINALYIMDDANEKVDFILIDVDGHLKGQESLADVKGLTVKAANTNKDSMTFGDDTTTLTYTVKAENYVADDANVALTVEVTGGANNTTGITKTGATIDMSSKDFDKDVSVAFDRTANAGTYTINIKANGETIETYYFTVNAIPIASTGDMVAAQVSGNDVITGGKIVAGKTIADVGAGVAQMSGFDPNTEWKGSTVACGDNNPDYAFAIGNNATVTVELTAKDNYVFNADTTVGTLSGAKATSHTISDDGKTMTIVYVIPC